MIYVKAHASHMFDIMSTKEEKKNNKTKPKTNKQKGWFACAQPHPGFGSGPVWSRRTTKENRTIMRNTSLGLKLAGSSGRKVQVNKLVLQFVKEKNKTKKWNSLAETQICPLSHDGFEAEEESFISLTEEKRGFWLCMQHTCKEQVRRRPLR